jgi:hypothetical protein
MANITDPPSKQDSYELLRLELIPCVYNTVVAEGAKIYNVDVTKVADVIAKEMLYSIKYDILGKSFKSQTITESVSIEIPATWWQHFKFRYEHSKLFSWFVKKWPVQFYLYEEEMLLRFDPKLLFIESKVDMPTISELGSPSRYYEVVSYQKRDIGNDS